MHHLAIHLEAVIVRANLRHISQSPRGPLRLMRVQHRAQTAAIGGLNHSHQPAGVLPRQVQTNKAEACSCSTDAKQSPAEHGDQTNEIGKG